MANNFYFEFQPYGESLYFLPHSFLGKSKERELESNENDFSFVSLSSKWALLMKLGLRLEMLIFIYNVLKFSGGREISG